MDEPVVFTRARYSPRPVPPDLDAEGNMRDLPKRPRGARPRPPLDPGVAQYRRRQAADAHAARAATDRRHLARAARELQAVARDEARRLFRPEALDVLKRLGDRACDDPADFDRPALDDLCAAGLVAPGPPVGLTDRGRALWMGLRGVCQ